MTRVLNTKTEAQKWIADQRRSGTAIAFVPTMGALHDGHLSLVREAQKHADHVVASLFVNPTQFAPGEDFETYPRTLDSDLDKLKAAGCSAAYCPSLETIYPDGDRTRVVVEGLSFILEGQFRPHFFIGVATVVSRFLIHLMPEFAVFGEKDYQQLLIIQRMAKDFGLPTKIIGAPTRREVDGLAMSSRNRYLTKAERDTAGHLPQALQTACARLAVGASIAGTLSDVYARLESAGFDKIDYITVRDSQSLQDMGDGPLPVKKQARILAAAWLGKTRLIDNMPVTRTD